MFALLKGTDAEYSVTDKLREIEVANENMNPSIDYTGKVSFFKCSAAYQQMVTFLTHLNSTIQGRTLRQLRGESISNVKDAAGGRKVNVFPSDTIQPPASEGSVAASLAAPSSSDNSTETPSPTVAGILALRDMLDEVESLIALAPPADKSTAPMAPAVGSESKSASGGGGSAIPLSSRFGSAAFRTFLNLLETKSRDIIERVLARRLDDMPMFDPDEEQSEQSREWERQGFETLREWKEKNSKSGHDHHHHHHHKLPPGVVISHGPTGVGNAPKPAAPSSSHDHPAHDSHDHAHESTPTTTHASTSSTATAPLLDMAPEAKRDRIIHHLTRYLLQSWGDIRRLDYGTGHELNFLCLLYAFGRCGVFRLDDSTDGQRLVGIVFAKYVNLMRTLQTTYWLEPAGSRGVWGLDDYSFLPFLFGSAQLIEHKHIKPRSVRYQEILDGFSHDYLYLDSIRFILSVKTCSFAEHSPMLNDITIIKTWQQVNTGLWRMYQAEVLGKFAVVQHFIYSPMLPKWPIHPLQVEVVKQEDPCCSDSIHFPSSIGAKKAAPPKM